MKLKFSVTTFLIFFIISINLGQTKLDLAVEKMNQDKLYDALVLIEQTLIEDSLNVRALSLYSDVNVKLHRPKEAIFALYSIEKIKPESSSLQNSLGSLFCQYGMLDSAIVHFNKGLKFAKDSSELYSTFLNKGTSLAVFRKFDLALTDLNKALEIKDDDIHLLNNIATIYGNMEDYSNSIRMYNKLIAKDSLFEGAHVNLGLLYAEIDSLIKAEYHLTRAIDLIGDEPYLLNNYGFLKYKQGQYDNALNYISKSISLDSKNSYAYRNRALVYIELGLIEESCEELKQAKEKGFKLNYGDEVDLLISKHCQN